MFTCLHREPPRPRSPSLVEPASSPRERHIPRHLVPDFLVFRCHGTAKSSFSQRHSRPILWVMGLSHTRKTITVSIFSCPRASGWAFFPFTSCHQPVKIHVFHRCHFFLCFSFHYNYSA